MSATTLPLDRPRALRTFSIPSLPLESGATMRHVGLAYYLDGTLNRSRDNVVLVLHALTGSADAAGDWWRDVIGAGRAIDTNRFAVLAPNLLGSCYGSTGPSGYAPGTFPKISVRDQARAVALLLEGLGIERVALATGGSLGGMVALELAASFPGRVANAVVFAAPARLGPGAIAWSHVQRRALDVGGTEGLRLAREIAMISYRTAVGFDQRFGRRAVAQAGDAHGARFAVQDWLLAHGERLDARFDAATYRTLIDAMDTHDIASAHGGIQERLLGSGTRFVGVGIPGDLFCPAEDVAAWTAAAGGEYVELRSPHGHDAFLIEVREVSAILSPALASTLRIAEVA